MAAIGTGWATDAWIEAAWITEAWSDEEISAILAAIHSLWIWDRYGI